MIKKGMKLVLFGMVLIFLGYRSYAQFTSDFFAKNVAIVAATERSISEKEYVRQIRLKIFEGTQTGPIVIGNDAYGFVDDGTGNDLVSGDGIYTTVNSFPYTDANAFNPEAPEKSVLSAAIVNRNFGHREELKEFLNDNPPVPGADGLEISLECDVTWCSCSSKCGGCYVSWGARRGCVPCPKFTDCKLTITWSIF
jgi:hypothetical protein